MRGFGVFLKKEFVEIVRTWRIWVLPLMVLFFALTGPVLAKLLPEILKAVGGSSAGISIKVTAEPTYVNSYVENWIKNLSQIVLFAILIIYAGLVSSERKSGTAILVLTKPVSRPGFVVAKFVAHHLFLIGVVCAGALVTWGMTAVLFPEAPFVPLAAGTGAWLVFGTMILALMTLLSTAVGSQAGAAGIGFGIYAVLALLTMWENARLYSPIGLLSVPSILAAGQHADWLWPVLTSVALAAAFVLAAAMLFRRQEI